MKEVLPVGLRPQETSLWCWAASGEMTTEYLTGFQVEQCEAAKIRLKRDDCCNDPKPTACVRGGWPDEIFDGAGLIWSVTNDTALEFSELKREISEQNGCGRRPVAFSWHWIGGGGHMMVAHGFKTVPVSEVRVGNETVPATTIDYIAVLDPWPPDVGGAREWITYSTYVSGVEHFHWNDYYEIRKK